MTSEERQLVDAARDVALRLHELLRDSGLDELAGGVAAILGELDAVDEIGVDTALRNVRSLYRSMTAGVGSLLDAFISHKDSDEQARLNDELTAVRRQLSGLLRRSQQTGEHT